MVLSSVGKSGNISFPLLPRPLATQRNTLTDCIKIRPPKQEGGRGAFFEHPPLRVGFGGGGGYLLI